MNKNVETNLYLAQYCKQKSLSHTSLKPNHQQIQCSTLAQLVSQYLKVEGPKDLINMHKQVTKILRNLRDSVDKIISNLNRYYDRTKIECQFDLSDDASQSYFNIISGKKQFLVNVKCSDLFQIYSNILLGSGKNNSNKNEARIKNFTLRIQNQLSEGLKEFNNFVKSTQEVKKQQKSVPEGKISQKTKTQQLSINDNEQARPTRSRAVEQKIKRAEIQNPQKQNNNRRYIKVDQVQKLPKSEKFNIKLKVIKIYKKFRLGEQMKIQFLSGDETGTAVCVTNLVRLIKPGTVIEITNCKMYLYKQKIKQIQSTRFSQIEPLKVDIKKIDNRYNLSQNKNQRQQKEEIKSQRPRVRDLSEHERIQRRKDRRQERQDEGIVKVKDDCEDQDYSLQNLDHEIQCEYYDQDDQQTNDFYKMVKEEKDQYTRIGQLQPDQEDLNMIAQIYKIPQVDEKLEQKDSEILCILGDGTGIVNASLPKSLLFIKMGNSIKLRSVKAEVVQGHILIKIAKSSALEQVKVSFPIIKFDNNMSKQTWLVQQDNNSDS